jgi:hypothetical protein
MSGRRSAFPDRDRNSRTLLRRRSSVHSALPRASEGSNHRMTVPVSPVNLCCRSPRAFIAMADVFLNLLLDVTSRRIYRASIETLEAPLGYVTLALDAPACTVRTTSAQPFSHLPRTPAVACWADPRSALRNALVMPRSAPRRCPRPSICRVYRLQRFASS